MNLARAVSRIVPATLLTFPLVHCSGRPSDSPVLTADMPLHLEDHLEAAVIEGSELPVDSPESIVWSFDEPQPDWRAFSVAESRNPMQGTRTDDAQRVIVTDADSVDDDDWVGAGIYTDSPGLLTLEPTHLLVRARTESAGELTVVTDDPQQTRPRRFYGLFQRWGGDSPMIADGLVHSYLVPLWGGWSSPSSGDECCRIGVIAKTYEPGSVDILSVTVVSRTAAFAGDPLGVMTLVDGSKEHRRALFTHTPGRVAFNVRVPPGGRLDVGLGVLRDDAPVDFRVTVTSKGQQEEKSLLEETLADRAAWAQRSVDLSDYEGQTVTLALQADAEMPGTVALWAAPTLSGSRDAGRPNVVFYIIDGGSAALMSVYGYNRRTTPNLERLAAEGAVFEQAYSNSTWTRVSTPSFMTSLQHSVLGGYITQSDPLPERAVTMAEHMHRGGYQTAVFTANPQAGRMSSLDRGVDVLRDTWDEFTYTSVSHSASSAWLHEAFWKWREAYPAQPYWVHFQTVDPHRPWGPVAPFTGLFGSVDAAQRIADWDSRLGVRASAWRTLPLARKMELFEKAGIDPMEYVSVSQGLYDEGMAHNDYQIGRLVNRIKAAGEWDNTIFILAADHAHTNAGLMDMPFMAAPRSMALFSPWRSHIPMIVVWPARIVAGQRFSQPVSMIDMVPTILELAGLPEPEITQGQSLAPLLLGQEGWEPRPVIFDEFYGSSMSDTLVGRIDVVDGRWGASLLVNEDPLPPEENGRANPLLIYDMWNDPNLSHSLHEERPDLVEKYTEFLEAQFAAHRALAQRFTRSGEGAVLTPEQLRTLRALGYIQ
ncbi:MAG: sulfatase [Gemmatimonadetes bacterium]|nr:sulfatase [Gemmatimonadota bacterium]